MTSCSSHVLDAVTGAPAVGVRLTLTPPGVEATTDDDGRVRFDADLESGVHTLVFDTGGWCAARGRDTFYPEVVVSFQVADETHVHVPLLLGPYSYTTYRGS